MLDAVHLENSAVPQASVGGGSLNVGQGGAPRASQPAINPLLAPVSANDTFNLLPAEDDPDL